MNNIDWNGLLHLGGMVAGGYVAAETIHWLVRDLVVPVIEAFAGLFAFISLSRTARAYINWKKAALQAAQPPAPSPAPPPPLIEATRYVSPLSERLRRR